MKAMVLRPRGLEEAGGCLRGREKARAKSSGCRLDGDALGWRVRR